MKDFLVDWKSFWKIKSARIYLFIVSEAISDELLNFDLISQSKKN